MAVLDLPQKIRQLFYGEHILQAHQRHRMGNLLKLAQGFAAHPLGGRIRQGQLRMGRFQLLQLPQQTVVFKVRHFRVIQHVVPVVRFQQKCRQFGDSLFVFHSIVNILLFAGMYRAPHQRSLFPQRPLRSPM